MAMKQTKLFIGSVVVALILMNSVHWYPTLLHELNHAIAALFTGNIPVYIKLFPEGSPMLGAYYGIDVTRRFIPFIDNFIKVSGVGLAVATPAIIWIIGLKIHAQGLAGFWIPGIPSVLTKWGNGRDFENIRNLGGWTFFLFIVTMSLYAIALWQTGRYYERHFRSERHDNKQQVSRSTNDRRRFSPGVRGSK